MLDQYIINRLKDNEQKLRQQNEQLRSLQREEESCNNMISELLKNEDVGIELFSPRNPENSTRQKVADIKKQIENIQLQQAEISEKISSIQSEEKKYQEMLEEIRERDSKIYQMEYLTHEEEKKENREENVSAGDCGVDSEDRIGKKEKENNEGKFAAVDLENKKIADNKNISNKGKGKNDSNRENEEKKQQNEYSYDYDETVELKNILNRVDKCLNLLSSNKSQCKNELINLKYYLKALISNKK